MRLIEDLKDRYTSKKMNGEIIPQDKIDRVIEAARLAPTSSGIQPFRVIQIKDKQLKEKIQPIAYGQSQIVDASHLLVFAAFDEYTEDRLSHVFTHFEKERGLDPGHSDNYKNHLLTTYKALTKEQNFEHAARQAYIAFGLSIAAAAELKLDVTPMEGFLPDALDKLLGLEEYGLRSVTILALGYSDEVKDWNRGQKKVRIDTSDFLINM